MYESQPLKCKHSKFVVYLVNIVRSLDKIVSSLSYGGHRVILMPWMVGSEKKLNNVLDMVKQNRIRVQKAKTVKQRNVYYASVFNALISWI